MSDPQSDGFTCCNRAMTLQHFPFGDHQPMFYVCDCGVVRHFYPAHESQLRALAERYMREWQAQWVKQP